MYETETQNNNACKADWSFLKSRENVDFIVTLSTFAAAKALVEVVHPSDSNVVSQRLTTPHRNCAEIAALLKFYVHHLGRAYLSGTDKEKQAEHLPPGRLPVWVERSREVTDEQVLKFVSQTFVAECELSTTVVDDDPSMRSHKWCHKHGWRYLGTSEVHGREDQCMVLMDTRLIPELISRGRNLLVIVTTRGKRR